MKTCESDHKGLLHDKIPRFFIHKDIYGYLCSFEWF